MRSFLLMAVSLLAAWGMAACSGGSDADCTTYCDVMSSAHAVVPTTGAADAGGCFGKWVCVYEEHLDSRNLCASRTLAYSVIVGTDGVSRGDTALCFRSWNVAPDQVSKVFFDSNGTRYTSRCVTDLTTLTVATCTTTTPKLAWSVVYNADNAAACEQGCKATVAGDGMPGALQSGLEAAMRTESCPDLLQAELSQQCASEAKEL